MRQHPLPCTSLLGPQVCTLENSQGPGEARFRDQHYQVLVPDLVIVRDQHKQVLENRFREAIVQHTIEPRQMPFRHMPQSAKAYIQAKFIFAT